MDKNAGDRRGGMGCILGFLALLVVIALSLQFVDTGSVFDTDSDAARVVLFAVAALLLPLGFARFQTLRSEDVDFWYYSLAIFGVVLLFFDSSTDRAVVSALTVREEWREQLQQTSRELERARAVRQELENVVGNPREMFSRIQKAAVSLDSIDRMDARVKACEKVNADLFQRQIMDRLKRSPALERKHTPTPPRLDDPRYLQPQDCGEIEAEWTRIATAVNRATHPKELRRLMTDMSKGVSLSAVAGAALNLRTMSFEELIDYLEQAWDLEATASVLDSDIQDLEARQRKERAEVDAPIKRPDPEATWAAVTRQFLWPYMVLSALALKLARRDYLKAILK